MPKLHNRLRVKEAAEFLGVVPNTVRNWGQQGKIPEHRHPGNNYRLFKKTDLEELLRRIEESGTYPSGRQRPSNRKGKARRSARARR